MDLSSYEYFIFDIEGTICPISFVKDTLYTYFLQNLPKILAHFNYPISSTNNQLQAKEEFDYRKILLVLEKLDAKTKASFETTLSHFQTLVANDVKDRVLKEFQGIVWDTGYKNGTIKVTMFPDAVEFLQTLSSQNKKIFIYSSGSIPAQKLLLAYVASDKSPGTIDLNPLVLDYFDINSSGIKTSKESYENILVSIKARFGAAETHQVVFFSDNILEVTAGTAAGITSIIVDKPGNKPVPENRFRLISDFASVSF